MFETHFNQSIQVNPTNIYINQGIVGQWFKNVLGLTVSRAPNMPNTLQRKPNPLVSANPRSKAMQAAMCPRTPRREADLTRTGLFQLSYGAASSPAE